MSGVPGSPLLTPSTVTAGKEQLVIVEFSKEIPQNAGLITFSFYQAGKKLSTVPAVPLGPRALKANFPAFIIYGEIEVVVHINRGESRAFPRFKLHVQSQLEAMFGAGASSQGARPVALLASLVAYLSHCDERSKELNAEADSLLYGLLQRVHTFELSDWSLQSLLAGKHGNEENLLHFCTRRGLSESAGYMLLGMTNSKKHHYLTQRSSDNKTPVDLARKNDLRHIVGIAEQMMPGSPSRKKRSNPVNNRKSKLVEKSKSIESDMSLLSIPGSPDANSFTHGQSPEHKGKKESKAVKMLRHFRKDKGMVISQPVQPAVNEFGEPVVAPNSPTLPASRSMEPLANTWTEQSTDPFSESNHHLASAYGRSSPQLPSSPLLSARHELSTKNAVTFPRNVRPASRTESVGSSSSSFDQGDPRLLQVDPIPRPVSSSLSGTSDYGSALSNAIRELTSKALYVAEVVREYNWTSVSQGDCDYILKVGEKVFVTQEGVEGDSQMCLGVWKGRYGKLPLQILQRLPQTELERMRSETEISDDDDDYEKIDDNLWGGDEDDIYKVPRNVPRPGSPYLPGSDSGDEQPVYDVPPSRLRVASLQPQIKEPDFDDDEQPVYDVPPNRLKAAIPQLKGSDSEDDPVYDIPPNRERSPSPDEHDYQNVRHGMFPISSMAAQLFSQGLEPELNKTGAPIATADGRTGGESVQLPAQSHRNTSKDSQIREKESAQENVTETAADLEDESNIYDEVDLEQMMNKLQQDFSDLTSQKQHGSLNTITTPQEHPQTTLIAPSSFTSRPHSGDRTSRARAVTDPVDVYSTLIPKSEMILKEPDIPVSSSGRGYDELQAVRNSLYSESGEMTVGRRGHTHETISEEHDDVFRKQSTSDSNPMPKKRSRLSTAPAPKVSPKPKPRRQTASTKSESEDPFSKSEDIVVSSSMRSDVHTASSAAAVNQSQSSPPSHRPGSRRSYINVEMREPPVKSKKPPRSPPRSRGPHATSSPAAVKRVTPPVAPKPGRRRK